MNQNAHFNGSGIGVAVAAYLDELQKAKGTPLSQDAWIRIVALSGVGALSGSLPDLIEPAINPNHRQFFHSVTFAFALAAGMRELYTWQPVEPLHKLTRGIALAASGAYLIHLAMDSTTPKSIPLLGKL